MNCSVRVCRFGLVLALSIALVACGSSDKKSSKDFDPPEKRIPVMGREMKIKADPGVSNYLIEWPDPAVNPAWAQMGGNAEHAPGNPALESEPKEVWAASVGTGSNKSYKLIAPPVVAGNAVYTMDSIGRVSAFSLSNGDRYWRVETTAPGRDGEAMGGGIGVEGNVVYVTTGFGEVIALRAADGGVIWRQMIGKPIRSAPTILDSRVFIITIENETHALDAKTGQVVWKHSGIAESAALMGASSPAAKGDTVVVAYSSGELFGLRAQNGRIVWGEVLSSPSQKGALPAIADIRGSPVIERGRVFAISHAGRMLAIDERSGERVWETDVGGKNTPLAVGNAVYVLTNDQTLMALTRDGGRVIWLAELQKRKKEKDLDSDPVSWFGPVMAGGRLWLTNSMGYLASFNPHSGDAKYSREIAEPFYLPPVVAGRTMLVLSSDGRLRAFR